MITSLLKIYFNAEIIFPFHPSTDIYPLVLMVSAQVSDSAFNTSIKMINWNSYLINPDTVEPRAILVGGAISVALILQRNSFIFQLGPQGTLRPLVDQAKHST